MSNTTRTVVLELDETDYNAVQVAVAQRQRLQEWPDSEDDGMSNVVGMAVAEICRIYTQALPS